MLPTDHQARLAIAGDLDATLFVEAGAGTGKTTSLVARVVSLVLRGDPIRSIAAITFTERAAAELRDRIRSELERHHRETVDLDQSSRLEAALAGIDDAPISTIHSFAFRLLAQHAIEAGLPPGISIIDDVGDRLGFDERWVDFAADLFEDGDHTALVETAITLGLGPRRIRVLADALHRDLDRLLDWDGAGGPPPPAGPYDVVMAPVLAAIDQLVAQRERCWDPADRLAQHVDARVLPWARSVQGVAASSGPLAHLDRIAALVTPERQGWKLHSSLGTKGAWGGAKEDAVGALDALDHERRDALTPVRVAVVRGLAHAVAAFVASSARDRWQAGRLNFADLVPLACRLLRVDPAVRAACRERFGHVLIDEFQDTDPRQAELAVLLASSHPRVGELAWYDGPLLDADAGRLFFVGDPKQSIYRFRRADVVLYEQARASLASRPVSLDVNFRSVPPVIDFVNGVFGPMLARGGDAQVAYRDLVAHRRRRGSDPAVFGIGDVADAPAASVREVAAVDVAGVVADIVGSWPVAGDGGADRPARLDDIAVLLPTRALLPHLERAFEAADLPMRIESRVLAFATADVRDLLSVLHAVHDPTDGIAVVGALRSPGLACSDRDLVTWRAAGGRFDRGPGPGGGMVEPPEGLDDHPVLRGLRRLQRLRADVWLLPVSALVERVIADLHLEELALAHRRARDRWRRLQFVIDLARGFEADGGRSLPDFLAWVQLQVDEDVTVNEALVPDRDDDAVRVLTVHAAKGLEFPVVILAGLDAPPSTAAPVVLWGDGGPEFRLGAEGDGSLCASPGYEDRKTVERRFDDAERVRLLYVGATRARDHLVVSLHRSQRASTCLAALLAPAMDAVPHLWTRWSHRVVAPGLEAGFASPPAPVGRPEQIAFEFSDALARRQRWLAARAEQLARLSVAPVVAATAIGHGEWGAVDSAFGAVDALAPEGDDHDADAEGAESWRRGRGGTSIGRAVHAVLQSVDLAATDGRGDEPGMDAIVRAQAAAEGQSGREGLIGALARSAVRAAAVRQAVAGGRYWRELFVASPIDGVVLEGFVDLLYETEAGRLVVVDFKTDAARSAADVDAAVARYRLQAAAYAVALEAALHRPVDRCVLVFTRPTGAALERDIVDLDAAKAEVRARLAGPRAGGSAPPGQP